MLHTLHTAWRTPATFRVHGKTRSESSWRIITVRAVPWRNHSVGWPFFRGTCTCWSAGFIAVGLDFAQELLADPAVWQVTREQPAMVAASSLCDMEKRTQAGAPALPSHAELLAHEIGHTLQARRYRLLYLPLVGSMTRFGEGCHWWNRFENEASATGQFGGIVAGSVSPALQALLETGLAQ